MVSTHSSPKAAGTVKTLAPGMMKFQHTAARRRLACAASCSLRFKPVSTHSSPKAAGSVTFAIQINFAFQHTAARRRLALTLRRCRSAVLFQHTAARRRLEADVFPFVVDTQFQHTAARRRLATDTLTESRITRFNTQQPEGGWIAKIFKSRWINVFQHTAARRRLGASAELMNLLHNVSTHSSPKAAGKSRAEIKKLGSVSTHSSPKAAGASLKSLAPSGFTAPISLSSQEKQKCEYNTAFSVASVFAIS